MKQTECKYSFVDTLNMIIFLHLREFEICTWSFIVVFILSDIQKMERILDILDCHSQDMRIARVYNIFSLHAAGPLHNIKSTWILAEFLMFVG